jgi:electron transport complex protein RnfC
LARIIRGLLRTPSADYALDTSPRPIVELETKGRRNFAIGDATAAVGLGDAVVAGQYLAEKADDPRVPCPTAGKVVNVGPTPDLRGGKAAPSITIEPADGPAFTLPGLDPDKAECADIVARLHAAAVVSDHGGVSEAVLADAISTLVVLGADGEPGVSCSSQLVRDRRDDVIAAARMLGRASAASKIVIAMAAPLCGELTPTNDVQVVALPPLYPESLATVVARRYGDEGVGVVTLEAALAALAAVRDGQILARKSLTVFGRDGTAIGNYWVARGARLSDIFAALELEPDEGDKVVAGGPMRGWAQFSLDGAIDAGIDALMLIPAASVVNWTDDPCINCGACIDVCPRHLQVQLLGRYAEFGLFDRTPDLDIDECIDCGLCATVCPARRPLLQLIRLAKQELAADAAATGAN